ncbi:class II D-tagatose-bisphosphate aldolase non-catalytic subunit, partial [Pseudomonas marginalis]
SCLREKMEQLMCDSPNFWQKYYHGDAAQQRFARVYSFSDRIRYYWPEPTIVAAINTLFSNLSQKTIPLPLLSQFLPHQFHQVR